MPIYVQSPMSATPVQLGTGATTFHEVPANCRDTIQSLTFKNSTANARTVTLYNVPDGDTASATNMICEATIPANGQRIMVEAIGKVLLAGATLQGLSDAATAIGADGSVSRSIGTS